MLKCKIRKEKKKNGKKSAFHETRTTNQCMQMYGNHQTIEAIPNRRSFLSLHTSIILICLWCNCALLYTVSLVFSH